MVLEPVSLNFLSVTPRQGRRTLANNNNIKTNRTFKNKCVLQGHLACTTEKHKTGSNSTVLSDGKGYKAKGSLLA